MSHRHLPAVLLVCHNYVVSGVHSLAEWYGGAVGAVAARGFAQRAAEADVVSVRTGRDARPAEQIAQPHSCIGK